MLDQAMTDHHEGTVLAVVVAPRAGKTGIDRVEADAVRIRVAAAPVDGAANAALLRCLADILDRPKSTLRLLAGETGRRKRILIGDLSRVEVTTRLAPLIEQANARTLGR